MPTINDTQGLCTVIVTVDADPVHMPILQEHAEVGLGHFGRFDGFVFGALHSSLDGTRLIQYLQWDTEADYRASVDDRRWDDLPSTAPFLSLMESGAALVDVRLYSVRATGGPCSV